MQWMVPELQGLTARSRRGCSRCSYVEVSLAGTVVWWLCSGCMSNGGSDTNDLYGGRLMMPLVSFCPRCVQSLCAYGASKLEVSDTGEAFIPDGSYLLDTNDARDR